MVGFDLGPLLQGQTRIVKLKSAYNSTGCESVLPTLTECVLPDSNQPIKSVQENGVVNGIECGGEIQKGEGCNRPFGHIEKNIIVNIKEGTFSRMVFSIS